jgi:hypothetical protein
MASRGLVWLADSPLARSRGGFCLTFVRGSTEAEVFAAFGADAREAVRRRWHDLQDDMHVQVGRAGDWLFALEVNSANGTRPDVLRRLSAGGEAVAVRGTSYTLHHQFGYAAGGDLVAAVHTFLPGDWQGSDPGRFQAVAREAGLGRPQSPGAPKYLQAVLTVTEEVSGVTLGQPDLDRPWPAAELPPLPLEELHFCLTFVQGATEDEIFAAFGARPRDGVPRRRRELENGKYVQVGRVGKWLFALELMSHDGIRDRMLRRMSAGGRAVAVHYEPGDSADFGYAAAGTLVARVNTESPHLWRGSDPGRFRAVGREAGLAGSRWLFGPDAARAALELAGRACGVPVAEAGGDWPWPTAPILPQLKDVPGWDADLIRGFRTGDWEIDHLVDTATHEDLTPVLATRIRRLIAVAGLKGQRELADAVEAALAGNPPPVTDADPAGLALRQLAWRASEAGTYRGRIPQQGQPPGPEDALERRKYQAGAAEVLLLVLAGKYREALSREIGQQRYWDPENWREHALSDLAVARAQASARKPQRHRSPR